MSATTEAGEHGIFLSIYKLDLPEDPGELVQTRDSDHPMAWLAACVLIRLALQRSAREPVRCFLCRGRMPVPPMPRAMALFHRTMTKLSADNCQFAFICEACDGRHETDEDFHREAIGLILEMGASRVDVLPPAGHA